MLDDVIATLGVSHRLTLMLFDAISDAGMACTLSTRGGRDVLRQFAHVHDNRRVHIEKRGRPLGIRLPSFPAQGPIDRDAVRAALEASQEGLERFFTAIVAGEVRGFRRGPVVYAAYFVAHEAHHRGNILLTLKTSGQAVPKDVRYALWDWDRR